MVVKSTILHLMVNRHHKLLAQLHQQVALLAPHQKQVPRRQHPKHHHRQFLTSQTARATRDEASTQAKQLATVETTPDQPKTFDAKVSTIAHNTTKRIVEGAMVVVGAVAGLFTAMARYSRTHID